MGPETQTRPSREPHLSFVVTVDGGRVLPVTRRYAEGGSDGRRG